MNGMGNREAGGDITGSSSTYTRTKRRSRRRAAPTKLQLGMNFGRTVRNWLESPC